MFNSLRNYNYYLIVVIDFLFIILLYKPYLFPLDAIGIFDHDFFLSWQLLINDALSDGQILHWAHHFCGGIPGLANPQSGALSPYNILGLIINPVMQMKINILIHFFASAVGFIFLTKRMGVSPYFSIIGFVIFGGNGFLLSKILHGQQTFYPFLYLPILIAFIWPYIAGEKNNTLNFKDIILGACIVSLIILEDGFQVLAYFFTFLFLLSVYPVLIHKKLHIIYIIFLWAIIAIGATFFRLFPIVELLLEFPRVVYEKDFMSLKMAFDAFFEYDQSSLYETKIAPHKVWAAYCSFIGWPPFILSIYVMLNNNTIEVRAMLFAALGCLLLMLGHFSSYSPWEILHSLPLFENVRAPNRFSSMVILVLSVLSILAAHFICSNISLNKPIRVFVIAIIPLSIMLGYLYSLSPLLEKYKVRLNNIEHGINHDKKYEQILVESQDMYLSIANNKGIYNCYRALDLPNYSVPVSSIVNDDANIDATVLPNSIVLNTNLVRPAYIVLNQNYHKNWKASGDGNIYQLNSLNRLLAVNVPPGEKTIKLEYIPFAFYDGLKISIIWCLIILFFIVFKHKRNERLK